MDLNDSNKLGTYHISQELQSYETARSSFFSLIIDANEFDDLIYVDNSYTGDNDVNDYVSGTDYNLRSASDVIRLSVNKVFVPHFKVGVYEVKRGNSSVKFADTPTWDSGTIEVQDFVGLHTKDVLMAWQALAYDVNSDTQGRAGDWTDSDGVFHKGYKKRATLVEYNPQFEEIRHWDLIGCWISGITESEFEKDSSGGRTISAQLEFDRAYMRRPSGQQ